MKQVFYWLMCGALSLISVWATAKSLMLLLPFGGVMNVVVAYVMAIGFMVIAALGTTMVVEGLTSTGYVENKNGKMAGGIVLVILFWLICSMPTNTHTFFYSMQINDIITNDISTTHDYLKQLADNKMEVDKFKEWERQVDGMKNDIQGEILNIANTGWGPVAKGKLQDLNELLVKSHHEKDGREYAYGKPIEIPSKMSPRQGVDYILKNVDTQVSEARAKVCGNPQKGFLPTLPTAAENFVPEAYKLCENMDSCAFHIDSMKISGNIDQALIDEVEMYIHKGYECIKNYNQHVVIDSADVALYVPEATGVHTNTARMKSVVEVWKDYFKGKYAGKGFFYFILLSILVDFGAFLFVNLAVKERENY